MLTIREAQIRALGDPGLSRYVDRGVEHVRQYFPEQVQEFESDEQLREAVLDCFRRAREYGLAGNRGCLAFLTLAFIFGHQFDRDPTLPWAAQVLSSNEDPDLRLNRLRSYARAFSAQATGFGQVSDARDR